jgi:putative DNA primase/helicase
MELRGDAATTAIATIDPIALAWKEMNDIGNAERLAARYGGTLAYVAEWGWVAYDGVRWSVEEGARLASIAAHDVARSIRGEIAALGEIADADLAKRFGPWCSAEVRKNRILDLRKWAVTSGMAAKTHAMLAQGAHLLTVPRERFDADLLAINAGNGTIRLRKSPMGWKVESRAHDPGDLMTRALACDYDPGAVCPAFERHMETVLPDPGVRGFVQEICGYALTGIRTEQAMVMLQGKGGDGKSTAMDMIREMMGGYAVKADVQTFLAGAMRSGGDATPDLARLAGDVRFVSLDEPKRGQAIDESRVKQFTGGSAITVRMLHGAPFEYVPRGLLIMECNSRPRISGDDDGIWRRILIVLFQHQFKGDAIDKTIKDRLRPEFSGILNWCLEGLKRWLTRGRLDPPRQVAEAIEDYRRAANPFGEWMAERVDTSDPNVLTAAADLFDDYKRWCEANGASDREVMGQTAFGRALGDRQILKGPKDGGGRVRRRGAQLRAVGSLPLAGDVWKDDDDDRPL